MGKIKNRILVTLQTESGCDPKEGEYGLYLVSTLQALDLGGGELDLIKEAIENGIDFSKLPEHGSTTVVLVEDGEWEDVFFNKYYTIENFESHEY